MTLFIYNFRFRRRLIVSLFFKGGGDVYQTAVTDFSLLSWLCPRLSSNRESSVLHNDPSNPPVVSPFAQSTTVQTLRDRQCLSFVE